MRLTPDYYCRWLAIPLLCSGIACAETTSGITSLTISQLYGPLEGYVQTPSGGQPGTTSNHRPTLRELGYHRSTSDEVALAWQWDKNSLIATIHRDELSGNATLTNSLVSQNKTLLSGDSITSHIELNWYTFSYQYQLLETNWLAKPLSFSPGIDLALFDFAYQLDHNNVHVDRAYQKMALRAGGKAKLDISPRLHMQFSAFDTLLPTRNQFDLLTMELGLQYELWKQSYNSVSINAGIAREKIDYEDEQALPNHIRVEQSPTWRLGMTLQF